MRKKIGLSLLLFAGISMGIQAVEIQGKIDRMNGRYACGENVQFTFHVLDDNKLPLKSGQLQIVLSNDGGQKMFNQTFDLAANSEIKVSGTLKKPGFLRAVASLKGQKKWNVQGAAFEPEKIMSARPAPADFDTFWQQAQIKQENTPADLKLTPLPEKSRSHFEAYSVSVAAPGGRVYGFLTVPKSKTPVPLLVMVPGAGPGFGGPQAPRAQNRIACLVMNVHEYDPMTPGKTVNELYKEDQQKGYYPCRDAADRDKYFYYRAILGINRAVSLIAKLPEIDEKRIGIAGSSQGGAFALILSGLNPLIGSVVANVPAMCDHYGWQAGRQAGWPQIHFNSKGKGDTTAGYYDAVNFARSIKVPTWIIVGFADTTCPPSSVYAAWNAIPSRNKHIIDEIGMGHQVRPSYNQALNKQEVLLLK